jgi:hypothetical protein
VRRPRCGHSGHRRSARPRVTGVDEDLHAGVLSADTVNNINHFTQV